MLVPAGFLVLLILGAIAVDSAIVFLAQRELTNQVAAVANDAAAITLSAQDLQGGRSARPSRSAVRALAHQRLDGYEVAGLVVSGSAVSADVNEDVVTVGVEGDVPLLFARALPGARSRQHVKATATAQLQFRG